MTLEQQNMIVREFEDAKGDGAKEAQAMRHAILALIDCQRKTAERVKRLSWKVFAVVFTLGGTGGTVISNLDAIRKALGWM